MSSIYVVYHSGYGHTKRIAQAVAEGARAELIAGSSNALQMPAARLGARSSGATSCLPASPTAPA